MLARAGRTFTLQNLGDADTIASLKRQIEELERAPFEAQALTWRGRTLGYSTSSFLSLSKPEHDDRTLAYCKHERLEKAAPKSTGWALSFLTD